MLDALLGAAIMVVATTSLLYSIEVAEKAFKDAGRYPLNNAERKLLDEFGLDDAAHLPRVAGWGACLTSTDASQTPAARGQGKFEFLDWI